jgi:hypothetical protein
MWHHSNLLQQRCGRILARFRLWKLPGQCCIEIQANVLCRRCFPNTKGSNVSLTVRAPTHNFRQAPAQEAACFPGGHLRWNWVECLGPGIPAWLYEVVNPRTRHLTKIDSSQAAPSRLSAPVRARRRQSSFSRRGRTAHTAGRLGVTW